MSVSVRIVLAVLSAMVGIVGMWIIGYLIYLYRKKHRPHISGKLVIDTTGEKDRWTIFFDDDLGDVEKMNQVVLSIERVE